MRKITKKFMCSEQFDVFLHANLYNNEEELHILISVCYCLFFVVDGAEDGKTRFE